MKNTKGKGEAEIPSIDDFENKYTMSEIKSHCMDNDSQKGMFETYDKDLEIVLAQMKKDSFKVWTAIDGDSGDLVIINGMHLVNRIYYIITNEAGEAGEVYQENQEDHEEDCSRFFDQEKLTYVYTNICWDNYILEDEGEKTHFDMKGVLFSQLEYLKERATFDAEDYEEMHDVITLVQTMLEAMPTDKQLGKE
jgi:hypothetical protein